MFGGVRSLADRISSRSAMGHETARTRRGKKERDRAKNNPEETTRNKSANLFRKFPSKVCPRLDYTKESPTVPSVVQTHTYLPCLCPIHGLVQPYNTICTQKKQLLSTAKKSHTGDFIATYTAWGQGVVNIEYTPAELWRCGSDG